MKELKALQDELAQLLSTNANHFKKVELNRIRKRIQFVRTCIRYLESLPSPEFLKKEETRLKKRISSIDDSFKNYNVPAGVNGSIKLHYNKEMGVPLLNTQLKTVKFILS